MLSELKMAPPVLVFAAVCAFVCFVEAQVSTFCLPPGGGSGVCKSLYDCPSMLELMTRQDRTPQESDLLKKSLCGFQGETPLICCPHPCHTPDGEPGKCINIYSCQHLAAMLTTPVSKDNENYVQNAKCVGADQFSVCCGPPRDLGLVPSGSCAATVSALPPDPSTECCGVDSSVGDKIVGGKDTKIDQYPWLVLIEYVKLAVIKQLCGGGLISGRYVLTAGHCVAGEILDFGTPKNVRLGEFDTSNDGPDCVNVGLNGQDCTKSAVVIPIERTFPHPGYNTRSKRSPHDIALIRLAQTAPYTDFIRPICLPTTDETISPPTNFSLYVAGWGRVSQTQASSNVKQHVKLPYVRRDVCESALRGTSNNVNLISGQLCAGGNEGQDSCNRDSGGPLMRERGRAYEAIGIVSFGPKLCGSADVPGVYTKVYEYISWIRSVIQP